jgi:hypothetical protein
MIFPASKDERVERRFEFPEEVLDEKSAQISLNSQGNFQKWFRHPVSNHLPVGLISDDFSGVARP